MSQVYRPELDGLRGMALLLVMAFHAQIPGFQAGFLGVDLFFVLSAYLITHSLLNELKTGSLHLSAFYLRRLWRLFPALFAVFYLTLPCAYLLLLPIQLKDYAQSLFAGLSLSSNFLFWLESGYFQSDSLDKPFIHTWSLAVEEQFYVLFPILLLGLFRFGQKGIKFAFTLLFILSLCFSEWAWRTHPSLNYYLPFSRVWELLAGSLLALHETKSNKHSLLYQPKRQTFLASLGLSIWVISICFYESWLPSPSLFTLIPVLSSCLLIACTQKQHWVHKLFCSLPLRLLGLISYSAYLWHQPCLSFVRQALMIDHLSLSQSLSTLIIALLLACLSYLYIERPYRRFYERLSLAKSLYLFIFIAMPLLSFAIVGHLSQGFPNRLSSEQQQSLSSIVQQSAPQVPPCVYGQSTADFYHCRLGQEQRTARYALVGDSHAGMYASSMHELLKTRGEAAVYMGNSWCVPLLDFYTTDYQKNAQNCRDNMSVALRQLAQHSNLKTILLVAEWSHYLTGQRYDSSQSRYLYQAQQQNSSSLKQETREKQEALNRLDFSLALQATIDLFQSKAQVPKEVIFFEPVPEYSFHVPKRISQMVFFKQPFSILAQHPQAQAIKHQTLFKLLDTEFKSLKRFSVASVLCPNNQCKPYQEKQPLYTDSNHLSQCAAKQVIEAFFKLEQSLKNEDEKTEYLNRDSQCSDNQAH